MIGFIFSSIALLLFSYTQVDLNLTLSQISIWQTIQKSFQYVGFYERPLATGIYVGILILLFVSYIAVLRKKQLDNPYVWRLIFIVTAILVLSYPAVFSYDFFNYLFTAKTVLVYRQNPYAVLPLQFAGIDPWTNFMRWTHLPSAYTPLWIVMSLGPYIVGLGYFLAVLFAMKFFIAGWYLLACLALYNITKSEKALAFFALNPLILIESLVSGHNDIVMIALALLAIYNKRNFLLFSLSVAAKFMTLFLLPVFWMKKNSTLMLYAMMVGLGLVLWKREFLPWYWVWILPFVVLNFEKTKLVRASITISFGLLLSYAPYLYFGEYSVIEQLWKTSIIWSGVALGVVAAVL